MKQGEKITIEQVLKSRGNISGASTLHDKSKIPYLSQRYTCLGGYLVAHN